MAKIGSEEYAGLWRASAMEKVPYTDDYPAPLLVLPELLDGALGQGHATEITTSVVWNTPTTLTLRVRDNGQGIKNPTRLKKWAAATSVDNLHRNGHGTKKALTMFSPNYATENAWDITYRVKNRNLVTISGPFMGADTKEVDDEGADETTLMPSGTEIRVGFEQSILGTMTSGAIFLAIKEIIRTRMSEETLRRVKFVLEVKPLGSKILTEDSHTNNWHSLQWHMEEMVRTGDATVCYQNSFDSDGISWNMKHYYIVPSGQTNFLTKGEFPTYGHKNQACSRAHIALNGRMIEAVPIHRLLEREATHNSLNGHIVFVNFTSADLDKMPQPSTTKVSLYDKDPIYMRFRAEFKRLFNPVVPAPRPPTPPPAPAPVPPAQRPLPVPRVNTDAPAVAPAPFAFLPPPAAPVVVKMTPANALKKICETLDIEWRCLDDGKIQLKEGGKATWIDIDEFEIVKV